MVCQRCGQQSPEATSFCPACGKKLVKSNKQLPIWLFVSLVCVLLAGVSSITWWLARRGLSNDKQAVTNTTTLESQSKPSPAVDSAAPSAISTQPNPTLTAQQVFINSASRVVTLVRYDSDNNPTAIGSGFLIANSTVATNYHVIRGATTMSAQFTDGSRQNVEGVLGYDPDHDVAVLRIDPVSASPLPLADASSIAVGDPVVAIGSPKGLSGSLSEGIISGIRGERIQTTAAISPGSSGGPLLNMRGQVIGLNTSQLRGDGVEALNFAVPINWAEAFLGISTTTPLTTVTMNQEVTKGFGPYTFQLPARQKQMSKFTTPENLSNAQLDASFTSSGGFGGHLRVAILHNNQIIYDSGDSLSARFSLKLAQGDYVLVVENTAMLLPRQITIQGKFSAVR